MRLVFLSVFFSVCFSMKFSRLSSCFYLYLLCMSVLSYIYMCVRPFLYVCLYNVSFLPASVSLHPSIIHMINHSIVNTSIIDQLTERFPALRCKNNFRVNFDAGTRSWGYRAVLVNMLFSLADGATTWRTLLQTPVVQQAWARLRKEYFSVMDTTAGIGNDPTFNVADELLRSTWSDRPVRFIVESQLVLQPYADMRKESHLWYKLWRAQGCFALYADFSKATKLSG